VIEIRLDSTFRLLVRANGKVVERLRRPKIQDLGAYQRLIPFSARRQLLMSLLRRLQTVGLERPNVIDQCLRIHIVLGVFPHVEMMLSSVERLFEKTKPWLSFGVVQTEVCSGFSVGI